MTIQELQRKSEFIKAVNNGDCETVEIGDIFGECYVVGEKRVEAADWLKKHTSTNMIEDDRVFKKMRICEIKFNVTVDTLY